LLTRSFQLGDIERLEQVIVRAQLHRFDGGLRRAVSGHQDDEQLGVHLPDAAERFHARDAAHADVHQDEVRLELGDELQALFAAGRGEEFDLR
jgi:hypothetical protein